MQAVLASLHFLTTALFALLALAVAVPVCVFFFFCFSMLLCLSRCSEHAAAVSQMQF